MLRVRVVGTGFGLARRIADRKKRSRVLRMGWFGHNGLRYPLLGSHVQNRVFYSHHKGSGPIADPGHRRRIHQGNVGAALSEARGRPGGSETRDLDGTWLFVVELFPSSPSPLKPQQSMRPVALSAQVCSEPAAMLAMPDRSPLPPTPTT